MADEATQARRRQVARRAHLVRQRTRLKNQVQAILHRNPDAALPGRRPVRPHGPRRLQEQQLPADEQQAVGALLRQLDFHAEELALIDAALARVALDCEDTRRLMTIPGPDNRTARSAAIPATSTKVQPAWKRSQTLDRPTATQRSPDCALNQSPGGESS